MLALAEFSQILSLKTSYFLNRSLHIEVESQHCVFVRLFMTYPMRNVGSYSNPALPSLFLWRIGRKWHRFKCTVQPSCESSTAKCSTHANLLCYDGGVNQNRIPCDKLEIQGSECYPSDQGKN